MKRLRLGLWLAGWSVWLWLGFGLYRELPRTLGTPIYKLPLNESETPWGFIAHRDVVVTNDGHKIQGQIRSWDVRTGRMLHRWRGSTSTARTSPKLGYVVGASLSNVLADPEAAARPTFNLLNGERTPLQAPTQIIEFHPTKPIVVMKGEYSHRLSVVDLSTGMPVGGESLVLERNERLLACRFVDEESFVLVIESGPSSLEEVPGFPSPSDYRLERWNFRGPVGRPVKIIEAVASVAPEVCGGRMLILPSQRDPNHLLVLDYRNGATIFDSSKVKGFVSAATVRRGCNPRLSADGRLLATAASQVWNVDEGRKVWAAEHGLESFEEVDAASNSVRTLEQWNALFGYAEWLNFLHTHAIRDFATGALKYRVRGKHPSLAHLSSDGKLGIAGDRIYEMKPRVDWLLLALCQTLLAFPIAAVWLMLRWRRKR